MVFKARDAQTYKLKVAIPTRNEGKPRTFSTGARDKVVAVDVERTVERWKGRRQWAPLEAVFDGLASLAQVYDAEVAGTLDALLTDLRDVDLEPLVTEWAKRANAKYVKQVRAFIPEGKRFAASRFRRRAISEFLATLDCSDPTKNRYRAALSVFGKWLVEREVIESNPVRDVAMYKERDPRMVWMTWADAERAAKAAPWPHAALYAIMAATGMELSAALGLTAMDIDRDAHTIHARGSKTAWRNRVVRYELWAHPIIERVQAKRLGAVALFPGITPDAARYWWRDAVKAIGLEGHRIHDLRHTYAVNALRKGYKPAVVAHQLGHKDATMVTRVYGRFVPDASDYETKEAGSATNPATATKKPREVKRAK